LSYGHHWAQARNLPDFLRVPTAFFLPPIRSPRVKRARPFRPGALPGCCTFRFPSSEFQPLIPPLVPLLRESAPRTVAARCLSSDTLMKAILNHEELEIVNSKLNHAERRRRAGGTGGSPVGRGRWPRSCIGAKRQPKFHRTSSGTHSATFPLQTRRSLPSGHHRSPRRPMAPDPDRDPHNRASPRPLHGWCLVLYLWDPKRKAIRRFTLSRMHSIKRTGRTFKPRKFDLEAELEDSSGVTSGKPVDVRILFRRKATCLVE
jgi:hypothetical protein